MWFNNLSVVTYAYSAFLWRFYCNISDCDQIKETNSQESDTHPHHQCLSVPNQEVWADSLGGRWWLPLPCGHPISPPQCFWFSNFSQSPRGNPPGLHLIGLKEEAVQQWVSGIMEKVKDHPPFLQDWLCGCLCVFSSEIHTSSPCVQCLCPLTPPLTNTTEGRSCVLGSPSWRQRTTCHWWDKKIKAVFLHNT